jgi:hypothetical protein
MPKGDSPTEIFSEHSVIPILLIMTSHVHGFTIGETETDHWLQLVTFGSYQSPKATIAAFICNKTLNGYW